MNRPSFRLRRGFMILALSVFIVLSSAPAEPGALPQYCQMPPYVFQSVLPSVTVLVSNSVSMLQFAYGDNVTPTNPCDNSSNACGGFDPTKTYYGLFDNTYWYRGDTGSGGGFTKTTYLIGGTPTNPTGKPLPPGQIGGPQDVYWHGNFLNWLTTRRVDVMRKVLTGGTGNGTQLCGSGVAEWKKFTDNAKFTPVVAVNQIVHFPKSTNCTGTLLGRFVLGTGDTPYYPVANKPVGTTSGIIQEMTPRASIGLAFFDDQSSDGANLDPQVDGESIGIAGYRNRIDTPSRFNGLTVGAPLAEALWTIVGSYARIGGSDATNGPRYRNVNYNPDKDPYAFHGGPSRCVKGSVIIISDGEPCNDGKVPASYSGFNIRDYALGTPIDCDRVTGNCLAAPTFGFSSPNPIPSCPSGGATAGFEDVALFAHTTDLRGPTFGVSNLERMQNLDIYVIRAFGQDNSILPNVLKYGAINGSFDLDFGDNTTGRILPTPGSYSLDLAYIQADNGYLIEEALRRIFENLLRRATSGTAASVLASGQGSGANLVQAVFYPRRRFFDEVIGWTGTLQNFWYFIDPFFGNASIREEYPVDPNAGTKVLHLVDDKTISFYFDQVTESTKAIRYDNDPGTGNADPTGTVIPFEAVNAIWEAGRLLHAGSPNSRAIYTVTDNSYGLTNPLLQSGNSFEASRASSLASFLGAGSTTDAENIINYVRGYDFGGFRQRTVPYPVDAAFDNTVWKLGDIINSTPRIVASFPLNTYHRTYFDLTYAAFTKTSGYKNRGMVFVGANDGMLHAFRLGKLEFPGDAGWTNPLPWQRARLRNVAGDNVAMGSERWAFIPKNALPYLQAMQDNNYCHLYYVDLAPQVFDASIGGASNGVRAANSWRTVLIGGMRLGGACRDNTALCTDCVRSPVTGNGLSSYFAIDVTNPEEPKVLWEFADPELGFATTGPAVVRINALDAAGNADRTLNGHWYVVFGSGPTGPIDNNIRQFLGRSDQNLKLFVLNLEDGTPATSVPIDTSIPYAFAGSMINSTADVNLDYSDDALYVGYVRADGGIWNQGGVLRLLTKGSGNPNDWAVSTLIEDIGPVTSSVVRLQNNILHTNWLFFGSGRYYFSAPSGSDDAAVQRKLFGVKDPCFTSVNTLSPTCTDSVDPGDLTSADNPPASEPFRGWFINLDTVSPVAYDNTAAKQYFAERVITDPLALSSGSVFFTTYRPYGDDCAIGGRTFLWAVQYNTGGVPDVALRGRALMQVSTASVEQLDLSTAFTHGDATLNRGGRRSYSLEGVPPTAQGLSLLSPPPPVKRILHMIER